MYLYSAFPRLFFVGSELKALHIIITPADLFVPKPTHKHTHIHTQIHTHTHTYTLAHLNFLGSIQCELPFYRRSNTNIPQYPSLSIARYPFYTWVG